MLLKVVLLSSISFSKSYFEKSCSLEMLRCSCNKIRFERVVVE